MCGGERIRNFNADIENVVDFQWLATDQMFQCLAFQQFHHDKRPVFVLTNIMNRTNIRMVQRGSGPRFSLESFQGLCVGGRIFRQKFQRDASVEPRIFGTVNYSHATATQLFLNSIMRNCLSGD